MTHFCYRVGEEKASEESLTLSNGEFANETACTEQECALLSQQAIHGHRLGVMTASIQTVIQH